MATKSTKRAKLGSPTTSNLINPIAPKQDGQMVKDSASVGVSDAEIFKDLNGIIQNAYNFRVPWSLKRSVYYRMRQKIRKDKDFPFQGCSNLRMPTLEKYIRKIKAALFNVVWGIKPHAIVIPEPTGNQDSAFKLEHYLDWLLEVKIKFAKKLVILIDKMLEKGFAFAEVIWKMEDEKRTFEIDLTQVPISMTQMIFSADNNEQLVPQIAQLFDIDMADSVAEENTEEILMAIESFRRGEKKVSVTIAEETYNNVDILIHDPEFVYVPVDSTLNPQEARLIAFEMYEPWDVVKRKAKEGVYDQSVVDEMNIYKDQQEVPSMGKTYINQNYSTRVWEDIREGVHRIANPSKNVKLFKVYAWYDLDGDGIEERNVFILCPEWSKVLAKFPLTYDHRKWPIIRFDAELTDDRWYSSRGIPEVLEDIVKEIDTQHNQKIDQQTVRNTPMFTFRSGVVNPKLVKFIPGQAIPVPGTVPLNDAVAILRNESSAAEFSYKDEEMLLKSEIQELFGQIDFSLQSLINRREPRTAAEVTSQQQSNASVFNLDALMFSESMSEMFQQIVQLTQQFLPEKVFFSVVGEGQPVHMTREEIKGGYQARVRGNDINTSPATRLQMTQARFAFLAQPPFLQSGIVTPQNLYMLAKKYLQDTGEYMFQSLITQPPPPQPHMPPPAITLIKPKFDELTDAEQGQVLESGGIQPDHQGRALEKAQELHEMSQNEPSLNGASNGQT